LPEEPAVAELAVKLSDPDVGMLLQWRPRDPMSLALMPVTAGC
jgi:hypothetical protein